MLTVLVLALIAAIVGLVRGGSLASLAATKVRLLWLVYAGVLLQIIGAFFFAGDSGLTVVLVSSGLIALFMILNPRVPGMLLAAVGLALNALVIGANGAMPVSQAVTQAAGGSGAVEIGGLKHEPLGDDTAFAFLGDVIAVPWLREVLSIGDVFLALGIAYFLYARMIAESRRGRHSLVE